ncbi:TPA: hypothetical protein ACJJYF_004896 [Enterobacter cloacae]|uniref:hypothetical protein n=1 Tax=Enterobacter TaxID=547 RepID=UPI000489C2C4|nr:MULTISPECIES: hypothetical protein [Enterobacter cloacae complex]MDU5369879.1 hypothetical protein [Enterobacter sp.]HCR0047916.1 hypothetical protein [Enterobacter hormaechei]HDT2077581.1 hypothetical protein [Enterobacter roggenkampii]HEG2003798.1 hypothetical protein [Enterobacter asburiae]MCD2461381.1 hypothetical protein [Enterobacter cloacae complex sp. 2021EL-01261]
MIRIEFNTYDDGTYYFLYVTEEVRIETNGADGLQMETFDSRVRDLGDPFQYLTINERKDEYFNESLINSHIDTVIKSVQVLVPLLTLDD